MTTSSPSFTTQGPSPVVSYGRLSAVPAPSYSQKVARQLLETTVYPVEIGTDNFCHDLTSYSCELCGGFFPTQGAAEWFISEIGEPMYVHVGCSRQVEDWA